MSLLIGFMLWPILLMIIVSILNGYFLAQCYFYLHFWVFDILNGFERLCQPFCRSATARIFTVTYSGADPLFSTLLINLNFLRDSEILMILEVWKPVEDSEIILRDSQ